MNLKEGLILQIKHAFIMLARYRYSYAQVFKVQYQPDWKLVWYYEQRL